MCRWGLYQYLHRNCRVHLAAWIPQNRDALTYYTWEASEDGGALCEWQIDIFAAIDGRSCVPAATNTV